jgi:membrane-bound metal-dependent hydrolase YbcI (DUF457 family)
MDVLAHTLWTNAVFHLKYKNQRRLRYLAAFFGVAPDLVGFAPIFIYIFYHAIAVGHFTNPMTDAFLSNHWTARFASEAYNYTHSLVIFVATFGLVLIIGNIVKKIQSQENYRFWFFWPMLGWALHILIDIPSHKGFYETPFLFPLSNARFDHGVPWAHPVYMAINYSLLILVYIGLFYFQQQKKVSDSEAK